MQNYLTLTVVISSGPDDKLRVRATSSEGQGNAKIAYIDMKDFVGTATGITRSSRAIGSTTKAAGASGQKIADELGSSLFNALFQGSVRDVLRDTASAAQEEADESGIDTGVRIRLIIDMEDQKTAEVASLPWELMRADQHRGSPMVLTSETTLVRSIDVPRSTIVRRLNGALRILLIKSNPTGSAPLNLDEESSELKEKIDGLKDVEVDEVRPERDAILRQLKDKKYHIVHYMGHGDFSPESGGMLLMEDEHGNSVKVSSEEFKVWMEHPSLRLVFLNACNTGTTSDELGLHPFAGVATALISSGLPAVIAMQFPISDEAAIGFSETFYERLAQGLPVEAAVTEGRKKLLTESEWATPVLYLRAKDGNLFDRIEENAPIENTSGISENPPAPSSQTHAPEPAVTPWYKKTWVAAAGGALSVILLLNYCVELDEAAKEKNDRAAVAGQSDGSTDASGNQTANEVSLPGTDNLAEVGNAASRANSATDGEPVLPSVNGRNATVVAYEGGAFELQKNGTWLHFEGGNVKWRYNAEVPDEWSVYLYDKSTDTRVQLDLYRKWISVSKDGGPSKDWRAVTSFRAPPPIQ